MASEPHIVIPEWMTPQQVESINKLFDRSPDGASDRHAFFDRVRSYGNHCGLTWCGMFVGIEKDGYAHT
jgi:hypothetical protein